jgi:hypothetical protein
MNETIYSSSHLLGVDEPGPRVREITFLALLNECGILKGISQSEIDKIKDIAVVWGSRDGWEDIMVTEIYNHDTGEVYWEDKEDRTGSDWSDDDEKLVSSLIMWGELESTIGEIY